MKRRSFVAGATALAVLGGCSGKFRTYDGPQVTRLYIFKEQRQLYLMHHDSVLTNYQISLGFNPEGRKSEEGDGKTPEGEYMIDRRNPNSAFHLSLGISYPNEQDVARARAMGKPPGGDIFIHGDPDRMRQRYTHDWTAGCVAVTDRQIEHIYSMVETGTPISIYP